MLSMEVRRGQQVLVHETMSSTTKQHKGTVLPRRGGRVLFRNILSGQQTHTLKDTQAETPHPFIRSFSLGQ